MKKTYISPQVEAIKFHLEGGVATYMTVSSGGDDAISDENQYLSNKRGSSIWGESSQSNGGIWSNMDK